MSWQRPNVDPAAATSATVRPDTLIEATVAEVRDFGVIVEALGRRGVVTAPEVSWRRVPDLRAEFAAGDRVRCRVLRVFPADPHGQTFAASIRRADPAGDPWRDPAAYRVGESFTAAVDLVCDYGVWLEHPRGARTLVRSADLHTAAAIGQRIEVRVTAVDADKRFLTASEAGPRPETRPTPR